MANLFAHVKAIRYTEYGSPETLQLVDVDRPVPKAGEVLIRIRASSINALDLHYVRGRPKLMRMATGLGGPNDTRLGVDVAGVVETVGVSVTQFRPGDEVFGVCRGAWAEYGCVSESKIAMNPREISFEQAAALPVAAITALQALRDVGKVQAGERVLVNGAGGGVGSFAVQIAAEVFGAEVTAVTTTKKLDIVRSIGAHHVIDYTREDFTGNGERYDVIIELAANHPLSDLRRVMTKNGRWVLVGGISDRGLLGPIGVLLGAMAQSPFVSQKVKIVPAKLNKEGLNVLAGFFEAGKISPLIDRTYPLTEIRDAARYAESGDACGKVVIAVNLVPSPELSVISRRLD